MTFNTLDLAELKRAEEAYKRALTLFNETDPKEPDLIDAAILELTAAEKKYRAARVRLFGRAS